jgi:hypothetical protein
MTPTIFSQKVEEKFATLPNKAQVKIVAHDKYDPLCSTVNCCLHLMGAVDGAHRLCLTCVCCVLGRGLRSRRWAASWV